jgi:hypothetical protein
MAFEVGARRGHLLLQVCLASQDEVDKPLWSLWLAAAVDSLLAVLAVLVLKEEDLPRLCLYPELLAEKRETRQKWFRRVLPLLRKAEEQTQGQFCLYQLCFGLRQPQREVHLQRHE